MHLDVINSKAIPKYRTIYEYYKHGIRSFLFKPGQRIDSITEIQKRFKVSRETAKQVLGMLCDDGLIVKAVGKGSFVADINAKKSHWAVIMPFISAQTEHLLYQLQQQALTLGHQLSYYLSYNSATEEVNLVGKAIHEGFQAVVVVPVYNEAENAEFYSKLNSGFTKVILANHTMTGAYGQYVVQSYDLGVRRGTRYLMQQTNRDVLFIHDDTFPDKNMVSELMEETFLSSVNPKQKEQKFKVIESVRKLSKAFLIKNNIGGVFCPTDNIAIKVLGRAKEWGLNIPDDLSLVSYGDTELAKYFTPTITSVSGHQERMANLITQLILDKDKDKDTSQYQYVIEPSLIIRET